MDQARATEELKERLRAIMETLPGSVALLDREHRLIFIHRLAAGFTMENMVGASVYAFLSPEHHSVARGAFDEVWRTGKPTRYEAKGAGGNGTIAWYTAHVGPTFRDGEVVALTVITEDITERKRAEQERAAGEARFRGAVEGSLDAFVVLTCDRDASGTIADFVIADLNAPGAAMIGLPRAELLGQRLCVIRPRTRTAGFFDRYAKVCATGQTLAEEQHVVMASGEVKWVYHQVVPLPDGVALTSRDITARKRLEAELRDALERRQLYAEELERKNHLLAEENAERERTAQLMRAQQEALSAMSAPIIQAWEGVLALPVIGALDSARAQQMMEKLLVEIARTRARFAILDLTGVAEADAATVSHLLRIVRAASLLGSRCLVSGISPMVAQTMVETGVSTEGAVTFGLLQDALRYALLYVNGAKPAFAEASRGRQ